MLRASTMIFRIMRVSYNNLHMILFLNVPFQENNIFSANSVSVLDRQ